MVHQAQQQTGKTQLSSDSEALSHWLSRTSQATLPLLPKTGRALRELVSDDQVSLSALIPAIAKDPIAILTVIRSANEIAQGTSKSNNTPEAKQIITLEHCVGVIGLTRLQVLISKAPILETTQQQTSYVNYVGSLMQSLHAAFQARHWATRRGHHQPQQLFLSALLYGSPYWALWQVAPAEMKVITHLRVNEKVPANEAEMAVLGITAFTLAAALAEAWQLPGDVRSAYDPQKNPHFKTFLKASRAAQAGQLGTLPNFDALNQPTNTPATKVQLANWLAQETDISWQSPQTQRCIAIIAAFLNQPVGTCQKLLRQQALTVSREYYLPGVQTPGNRLLQPRHAPDRRNLTPSQVHELVATLMNNKAALAADSLATQSAEMGLKELVTKIDTDANNTQSKPDENIKQAGNTAVTTQAAKPSTNQAQESQIDQPRLADLMLFKKVLTRLRQQGDTFADSASVLQLAGHAIVAGIGLGRTLIFIPEPGNKVLRVSDAFGQDTGHLHAFKLPLNPPNLFTKLMQKPAALRVDKTSNNSIMTLLPAAFEEATNEVDHFFTTSLFVGKTPLALIYADQGAEGAPMEELLYTYFKTICKAAGHCINNKQ